MATSTARRCSRGATTATRAIRVGRRSEADMDHLLLATTTSCELERSLHPVGVREQDRYDPDHGLRTRRWPLQQTAALRVQAPPPADLGLPQPARIVEILEHPRGVVRETLGQ